MRIGMILDETFPPDSRVENEAVTLINSGHKVFLFCLTYGKEKLRETINDINVRRYNSNKVIYKFSAFACDFPFYKRIMKQKIKHFIKDTNVEVLHIHDIRIAEAVFEVNFFLKLPLVLDLHENRPEIMKFYPHLHKFPGKYLISPKKWKKKEEEFVKYANKIIVVTNKAADEIVKRTKIDFKKIVVIPNSVRKSFYNSFTIDKKLVKRYKNKFVILYLGDTNLRRGLLTAIEASKKLSKQIKNYKLTIVGKNSTDYLMKDKVKELDIEDYVDFEGWKDASLFQSYIITSNICISPLHRNLHHDTTYANKIFQYMSFGKPLLVSDAVAQKEIVKKSNSGLIHKEKDVQDFTQKVLELYKNKSKSEELGKNGKKFIEGEFSWEYTSKGLLKLYDDLKV